MARRISESVGHVLSTRLSTEELDFFLVNRNGVEELVAEVRSSWADAEAARRALRDLVDGIDSAQPPLGSVIAAGWTRFDDALTAARAVLSGNKETT